MAHLLEWQGPKLSTYIRRDVLFNQVTRRGHMFTSTVASLRDVPFPDSLVIDALGSLIDEIEIHRFAAPLLIWIVSGLMLG